MTEPRDTLAAAAAAAAAGKPDPAEIIHIAGLDVKIGTRMRQRCAWCGAVLIDVALDRTRRAIEPGQPDDDGEYPTWPVGTLGVFLHWFADHPAPLTPIGETE